MSLFLDSIHSSEVLSRQTQSDCSSGSAVVTFGKHPKLHTCAGNSRHRGKQVLKTVIK